MYLLLCLFIIIIPMKNSTTSAVINANATPLAIIATKTKFVPPGDIIAVNEGNEVVLIVLA